MNYIVFDLEWNQCPNGQKYENPRIPFEIIEIGAVKLDSEFNIVDEYSSIVKPRIYKHLHNHIREMLNYDETFLRTGRPFDMVYREFLAWCGKEDYTFCTWGAGDLFQLQKNMDYYYMKKLEYPLHFYNIQEIFAYYYPTLGSCKLEKAVAELQIPISEPFHYAINDARYTGLVFQKLPQKNLSDFYSIDYYNNPKTKEDEIISYHRTYSEHISREFNTRPEVLEDKELSTLRCYKCKRKTSKKIKWFSSNPNTCLCVGKCWSHGYMKGSIKFKNASEDKVFVIKKTIPIKKNEIELIKQRQEDIRQKRKEKRQHKKVDPN